MSRMLGAVLCAAMAGGAATLHAQSAPPGFSAEHLDRAADPCSDFYQFACGGWLARNPLPADRARYNRMTELIDRNEQIIRGILERAAAPTPARSADEQKLGDYYASCMDEATVERRGAAPIAPLLREVDAIRSRADLLRMAARFNREGLPGFVAVGPFPNARDSSRWIGQIGQGALGLPDRDLYLRDDERSATLRREYRTHIVTMFELLGTPADAAERLANGVMDVETAIARASYDRTTLRDPRRRDNPMTGAELAALGPAFDFPAFLRAVGVSGESTLNVLNPQYVRDINAALEALPLDAWKAYLRWHALASVAEYLSSPFVRERFRFTGTVLSGQQEMRPRWQRCLVAVAGQPGDDRLGEIVGEIFVREHYGAEATRRMNELIAALERSLDRTIRELDWMSPATRQRALEKLKAINHKIGAPQQRRDFDAVRIDRDDLVGNTRRVIAEETRYQLGWIDQPVDRDLWVMTPQTVNAYYAGPFNEIAFPAGILQPPYFDVSRDDAVNFGGIGAVIGHELSHGFDDQGRKYDARGNLTDWWTPEDDTAFRERASCVATQYSQYPAVGDTRLNGELTLGENVADNAGVRIAFYALLEVLEQKGPQPPIDGFTPEQRFFLAWAQVWCENATEQNARRRAQEDVHANGRWRANGVLRNSPEFRKAFGCQAGAPMAPATVCRVW